VLTASRGVKIVPDGLWMRSILATFDAIMIPGGKGVHALKTDERLLEAIRGFRKAGKWIGAVCAGPWCCRLRVCWRGTR